VTVSVVDWRAVKIMLNAWTIPSAKESEHYREVAVVAIGRSLCSEKNMLPKYNC